MQGIITWEKAIDVSAVDYTDPDAFPQGFYFRCGVAGNVKYVPLGNTDAQALTQAFDASTTYNNPILVKKIFAVGTTATDIVIGKAL